MPTKKQVNLSKLLEPIKDPEKIPNDVLADMIAFHVPSGVTTVIQDVEIPYSWYVEIREAFDGSDPIIKLVTEDYIF